jgi:hypothetical protein
MKESTRYRIIAVWGFEEWSEDVTKHFADYSAAFAEVVRLMDLYPLITGCLIYSSWGTGIFLRRSGVGVAEALRKLKSK